MKRAILLGGCTGLFVILVLQFFSHASVREVYAGEQQVVKNAADSLPAGESQATCARPATPVSRQQCAAMEQQVLAATVRLELRVYKRREDGGLGEQIDSSVGHATIKNGRYLVTHNHYGVRLRDELPGTSTRLSVFKAGGEMILLDAPLTAFQVALENPQTLVLDFGNYGGQGLFAILGMSSAELRHRQELSLQPGLEVAQLDWDGRSAYVDWVTIEEVVLKDGTLSLRLSNDTAAGSSGGPVFWNGYHIANNWLRAAELDSDDRVTDRHGFAALNSAQVAAFGDS